MTANTVDQQQFGQFELVLKKLPLQLLAYLLTTSQHKELQMTVEPKLKKEPLSMIIRKSILAIAVAAASSSAFAAPAPDFNFEFTPQNQQLEVINDVVNNFTVSGTSTINANSNNDAIGIYGVAINGDLKFTGSITSTGTFADGIDLDRSGEGSGPGVSVEGRFINEGSINITGLGARGIITDSASLMGGFVNSGTIRAVDQNSTVNTESPVAIEFSNSSVAGFNNTGTIYAEGVNASAVLSSPNDSDPENTNANISDDFVNSGTISAVGTSSTALDMIDTIFQGGIENSGTISAAGPGSKAIDLDGSTIQFIDNSSTGRITATGSNSTAILVDGGRFSVAPDGERTGIINRGLISGQSNAIKIENQNQANPEILIQQQAGHISGGTNAIDGGNHASLSWTGGKITGNLINLNNVTINGGAEGLLFEGDTIKAATINLETGKLTLSGSNSVFLGDLILGDNSIVEMFVGKSTDASQPILDVSGGVTVGVNSTIALEARKNDFSAISSQYTILQAESITNGQNLNVQASSQLLTISDVVVNGDSVVATVTKKGSADLAASVIAGGGSGNASNAVQPFASAVMALLDENDPLYIAFANASTEEELAKLAEQLTPEVNSGANSAALNSQSLVNNAIGNRSAASRGAAGGDLLAGKGLWIQALHSDAEQDMRNGIEGYNADSSGIAIGIDGKLNEATTLGVAYSYLLTDVKGDDGNKTDVKSHALTVYTNWQSGNWFADGGITFGSNSNDTKRYIAGTVAKGDFDSQLFGLNALAGYTYRLNDQAVIEPQVGARYSNIKSDSYSESGSGAALRIGSQRFEIGEVGAGARIAGSYALGKGLIEPEAKVMLWHDLIGDKVSTTSSFLLGGSAFTTTGAIADRNSVQASLGANYKTGAWTVGASYDYVTKADFNADTFSAKVRYDF